MVKDCRPVDVYCSTGFFRVNGIFEEAEICVAARRSLTILGAAQLVAVVLMWSAGPPRPSRGRDRPDLHQGHRADPLQELRRVPPRDRHGADGAHDLRGCAPVGARGQAEGRLEGDAAVGRRPDRRQVRQRHQPEQAEIDTIAAWVDGGAPEGSKAELPKAPVFAEGWSIGKPDSCSRW